MPFNKETAAAAGRKSKVNRVQIEAWKNLSLALTGKHAGHVTEYLEELWKHDREAFIDTYLKLLQYVKPKVVAHAVKTETEITFKFEGVSKDLIEKI